MQHCTKHYRYKAGFYSEGLPPPLTSPKKWFLHADASHDGFIQEHNIIKIVCANLRPTNHSQHHFIAKMISSTCQSCSIDPQSKMNVETLLKLKTDKRLIRVEQEFERTFRSKLLLDQN